MARLETSSYCEEHCWVGPVGKTCPKCQTREAVRERAAKLKWDTLTTHEKIEELRKRVEALERAPHPDALVKL